MFDDQNLGRNQMVAFCSMNGIANHIPNAGCERRLEGAVFGGGAALLHTTPHGYGRVSCTLSQPQNSSPLCLLYLLLLYPRPLPALRCHSYTTPVLRQANVMYARIF